MDVFRLLATGSRDWSDWAVVDAALTSVLTGVPFGTRLLVVHGGCPDGRPYRALGFDAIVDRWARSPVIAARHPQYRIGVEVHRADWQRWGKRAGRIRNQEMVDAGADLCVAGPMPQSIGTYDCMRRARAAGIEVVDVRDLAA